MARKKNVQQSNRKSYRQRMGYTQQQMADILGVSRRSVIRYEKGQVKSGKAFDKLSQFYRNAVELNENIKDKSEKALERYKELSKEIQQHYKVEIVRCKDCVLKYKSNDGETYCYHSGMPIKPTGYCDCGTKCIATT